jgi:hypothetical protein
MKTPEKIYISPSIRTEIAYYSRILIGNPKFNICPRYGNEIEYIRTDIHMAEINALKAEVDRLQKDSDVLNLLYAAGVDNWEGYEDALAAGGTA